MDQRDDVPERLDHESAGDVVRAAESPSGSREPGGAGERTYPSTVGGLVYLVMLLVATVGVLTVILADWRTGIRIFAGVLLGGAVLRLALPERDAGMLAVRSKPVDVGLYLLVGCVMLGLASSIPDQPL